MDLAKYDITQKANDGADLVLEHPVTGEKLDAVLTLVGHDSDLYSNKIRDIAQKQINNKSKSKSVDFANAERQSAELLASCTIGWKNIEEGGKAVPFSKDACFQMYLKYKWIREQVDKFVGDRGNFFTE